MAYQVEREDFSSLDLEWQALLPNSRSKTVFSTPQWQQIWWEELGQGKELQLLSVRHQGTLVGVAPLAEEDGVLSFGGGLDVCDYLDFIVAEGQESEVFSSLWNWLSGHDWHKLDLHSLRQGSPTLQLLADLARTVGCQVEVTQENVCPRLELPATWEEYLTSLSKKDRHELRRKMRRLTGAGDIRFYHSDRQGEGLAQDLEDFLRLHRQSREEKAVFMSPIMERFFRAISEAFVPTQVQRIYFLEIDGVRAASTICFDYADELALYNSGYDLSYASLSVGLLLKALCLKDAILEGKRAFDFLRGDEPYKYDLGGADVSLYRCTIERA